VKRLLVRHAAAVPRGMPGIPDDERPLTPKGRAKFSAAAKGLARIARRPDVLLTSPLPRARATAEIAARAAPSRSLPNDPDIRVRSPAMTKCEACGTELKDDAKRFCSEACRGIFMEGLRHGTRRSPGRTTAKRRRRRGR